MNPVKKKIQDKMLKAAAKKSEKSMPKLMNFAVSNDQGYIALLNTIRNINKLRKNAKRWVFEVAGKQSR